MGLEMNSPLARERPSKFLTLTKEPWKQSAASSGCVCRWISEAQEFPVPECPPLQRELKGNFFKMTGTQAKKNRSKRQGCDSRYTEVVSYREDWNNNEQCTLITHISSQAVLSLGHPQSPAI